MAEPRSLQPLLIQFAKAAVAGAVKTRMQPTLSAQAACDLHVELLQHTAQRLAGVAESRRELWVDSQPDSAVFRRCLECGVSAIREQRGANLGERMLHALSDGLRRHSKVVLVGSDCPFLDADYLCAALRALDDKPVVLGPAEDGGYVLVGATAAFPPLFQGIAWGTGAVLAQTLAVAASAAVPVSLLPARRDIDRPEDLPAWYAVKGPSRS